MSHQTELADAAQVVFVGAGPGDPDLISRAGWKALKNAEVVLFDALLDEAGFRLAAPQAEWIPVGKRAGRPSTQQEFIGRLLVNHASRGRHVVRLKGGDPAIFGRLSEEIEAVRSAGLRLHIVPGITAASAAAADLQISLTERTVSRSVVFVTPSLAKSARADDAWLRSALSADTAVIYMGGLQRQDIATKLLCGGLSPNTPVALVENASGEGWRQHSTISKMASERPVSLGGPVLLIVGQVARNPWPMGVEQAEEVHPPLRAGVQIG